MSALHIRIAPAKIQKDFDNESIFPFFLRKNAQKGVQIEKNL